MQTDYIGAASICSLIEATGLKKFIITRAGTHKNNHPVYEHLESGSLDKTISAFSRWANISDNSLPYEMVLFNSLEDSELTGEEVRNKKTGKVLRFTFALNKEQQFMPMQQQQNVNVNEAIENALMKLQMRQQDNELMKRLEALDEKVNNALLNDGDDDDDDDEEELSGLNSPHMATLMGLLNKVLNPNKQAPAPINGINEDQKTNINKAIRILAKHDPNIDEDLLKLADIAEKNNSMFNMLLNSLRSM